MIQNNVDRFFEKFSGTFRLSLCFCGINFRNDDENFSQQN